MTVLILMVTKMMTIFSRSFQGVGHYCVPPSLLSSSARISFHVSSHVWLSLCALSLFRLFLSHRLNKESKISSHVFLRRRCLTTNCSISCLPPAPILLPKPHERPRCVSISLILCQHCRAFLFFFVREEDGELTASLCKCSHVWLAGK